MIDLWTRLGLRRGGYAVAGAEPSFFDQTAAAEALGTAWAKVRANGGCPGGDGVSVAEVARGIDQTVDQLRRALLDGHYRPGPLRRVSIRKPDGGERRLAIPCVVDRIVQTSAARVLGQHLDRNFSPDSYGYRPGRSVEEAITRVAILRRSGYLWTVDGDIRKFFDTVRHGNLLRDLAARVSDRRFLALVEQWLAQTWERGVGLPQGLPVSPVLANLALDRVDHDILSWPRCRWIRYADDFLLLCRSSRDAEEGLRRLRQRLRHEGLALHTDKTRLVAPAEPLVFLGYRLGTHGPPPPGRGYPDLPRGAAWASLTDVSGSRAAVSAPRPAPPWENPYGWCC